MPNDIIGLVTCLLKIQFPSSKSSSNYLLKKKKEKVSFEYTCFWLWQQTVSCFNSTTMPRRLITECSGGNKHLPMAGFRFPANPLTNEPWLPLGERGLDACELVSLAMSTSLRNVRGTRRMSDLQSVAARRASFPRN